MVELRSRRGFIAKTLDVRRRSQLPRQDHFESDSTTERFRRALKTTSSPPAAGEQL
jgi:hypothetical protein